MENKETNLITVVTNQSKKISLNAWKDAAKRSVTLSGEGPRRQSAKPKKGEAFSKVAKKNVAPSGKGRKKQPAKPKKGEAYSKVAKRTVNKREA